MLLGLISHFDTFVYAIVALVIAISVHEFSHALIATRLGDMTAKLSGRLTLNPLAHLDPVGSLVLLIAGFGWGRPVPYNPHFVRNGVWGETMIALAGPISNIIVALLFALPQRIIIFQTGQAPSGNVFDFLAIVVTLNVFLAAFNLLPVPPLDGSKLLYLIVDKLTFGGVDWWASFERIGPMILLTMLFAERIFGINIIFRLLEPIIFLINWIIGSSVPLF
ncbi:TPA: site-2 protease family protein [Patescibacteria group bacterium]|nr:site-2 protease family protein [Patescibacteria group bacterium]